MEQRNHYFFAVKLPDHAKQFLHEWIKKRQAEFPFQGWVHPQDYHITLAFLGFAEHHQLSEALKMIENSLTEETAFTLTFDHLGIFGQAYRPRIFWAGVEQSDRLYEIQKKVYNDCIQAGFELDKKPFRPHITIARKWAAEEPFQGFNRSNIALESGEKYSFFINEIVLYETHVNETPKYKVNQSFSLIQ